MKKLILLTTLLATTFVNQQPLFAEDEPTLLEKAMASSNMLYVVTWGPKRPIQIGLGNFFYVRSIQIRSSTKLLSSGVQISTFGSKIDISKTIDFQELELVNRGVQQLLTLPEKAQQPSGYTQYSFKTSNDVWFVFSTGSNGELNEGQWSIDLGRETLFLNKDHMALFIQYMLQIEQELKGVQ